MADVLGAREGAIAKELTKLHENVTRGELSALVFGVQLLRRGDLFRL